MNAALEGQWDLPKRGKQDGAATSINTRFCPGHGRCRGGVEPGCEGQVEYLRSYPVGNRRGVGSRTPGGGIVVIIMSNTS